MTSTTDCITSSSQTIKIIGAGFGRTGTASLKESLEILGFKCYHMGEIFSNPKLLHSNLWIQAFEGKLSDYDLIFKSSGDSSPYTATVDWPSTAVYEDILKQYSDAKVILTVRDSESWYKR